MSNLEFRHDHRLDAYFFDLPEHLIAQKPIHPRSESRMLVLHRKEGRWEHRMFRDLKEYLDSNDRVVVNNTQVIKARLLGQRLREENGHSVRGGNVEFVLLEEKRSRVWEGLFHASAKYLPGLRFEIPTPDGKGLFGVLIHGSKESPTGTVVAEFDRDPIESGAGEIPLPHYIQRVAQVEDETDYQTVYAKVLGSAAAPTAGLHFTHELIESLRKKGVSWDEVTLHVGLGTFRPVKEPDIRNHLMHEERYEITPEAAKNIQDWKSRGKRILAVGTTTVRTLESAWERDPQKGEFGSLKSGMGRTMLFIRPGDYQFKCVDRMITNFHLPRSTLLMLVCAFAGRELTLAVYEEAIRSEYRFFSYGDAMLIL